MKKLLSFTTILFSVFVLTAQTNEVLIEYGDGASFYDIYPIADGGFDFRTIKRTDETETMFYSYYDENMTFVQKEQFTLPVKIRWEVKCEDEEYIHTIYRTPKRQIVVRTASKIEFEFYDIIITQPKKSRFLGVTAKGDYLWFKLYSDGGKIWRVNWRTGEGSFFPVVFEGIKEKDMVISEALPISSGEVYVIIQKKIKKSFHEYALRISAQGEVLETHLISKSKLVSTQMLEKEDGSFLFIGTYSTLSKHPMMKGTQSEGLKIISITDNEVTSNQDLSFNEIPGFRDYSQLGELAEQYRILSFDVVPTSHGHIIVGSAYARSRSYDNVKQEFTDYDYRITHGFVCAIDEDNEIAWKDAFEIKDKYGIDDPSYAYILRRSVQHLNIIKIDEDIFTIVSFNSHNNYQIDLVDESVTKVESEEDLINEHYNAVYWFGDKEAERNEKGDITATYIIKREKK